MSRRCLQLLLRDHAKVKAGKLSHEIQQVLDSHQLPPYLEESIDGVRTVGNLAAHPEKDANTGAVLNVEPGEAEWLLDTLEELFEFYFDGPARRKAQRNAVNAKLASAGKPPMK